MDEQKEIAQLRQRLCKCNIFAVMNNLDKWKLTEFYIILN